MYQVLMISFLVIAVALVAMILVQHGKGADMGASFGAGASNTVFGSSGSGNFLTKTTAILAALFFATALALGYMTSNQNKQLASDVDIAAELSNEGTAESVEVPAVETGIPSIGIEDVPATEAAAIPDAPVDEAVEAAIESTIESAEEEIKDNGEDKQ